MKKIIINEQESTQIGAQTFITDDNLLQQGLEFNCFTGYNLSNEKFEGKTALIKDSKKSPGGKVYATSTDRAGFFNLVTKDAEGNVVSKKIFNCEAITTNSYAKLKLRTDQERTIKPLLDSKRYKTPDDTEATQNTYNWINIHDDEDAKKLLGSTINQLGKPFMMWKLKGKLESFDDPFETDTRTSRFLALLEKQGWEKSPEDETKFIKCDLANTTSGPTDAGQNCYKYSTYKDYIGYAQLFPKKGFTFWMPKTTETGAGQTSDARVGQYQYFCKGAKDNNYDKKSCYNCILNYFNAAKNGGDTAPDPGYKEMVEECLAINQENFPKLSKVIDYLRGVGMGANQRDWLISRKSYKQSKQGPLGLGKVQTNENIKIKKIIHENLTKMKNNKKGLLNESKIINNRLIILAEGRDLRKKKNLDIFFNRFLNETAYLNTRGYDKRVINEQFWNMLSNFFGGTGMDSVLQYFKEYAAKWLLGKFGVDPNTWIGSAITVAVGNINIGDIPKLTNCDYLVPLISKSLLETLIKKFLASKNFDNAITDILRNVFVELIDNVQFVKSLQDNLAKLVCPWVKELGNKMSAVTNNLTQKSSSAPQIGNLLNSTTKQLTQGLNQTANQLINKEQ
jgi:hypothetical protein